MGRHLLLRLSPPTQGACRLGRTLSPEGLAPILRLSVERPSILLQDLSRQKGATLWNLMVKPPCEAELRQFSTNPWHSSQTPKFSRALGLNPQKAKTSSLHDS